MGKSKKVTFSNYLILIMIFIFTIIITLYVSKFYQMIDLERKKEPVIRGYLSEININEVNHYITENANVSIYMCTSDNIKCRIFEKDFKKIIVKESLMNNIVYLNLTGQNSSEFFNNFNNKFAGKKKLKHIYPTLVVIDNGRVFDVIQANKNGKLNIEDVNDFVKENIVGDYNE